MKPVNSQLFYYVLLVYAVGMVAFVALPIKPSVVIADSSETQPNAEIVMPLHNAAGVTAHPVSLGEHADPTPLLSTPATGDTEAPAAIKDAPQSL